MVVLRTVPWALHVHLGGPREARLQDGWSRTASTARRPSGARKPRTGAGSAYVRRAYGVDGEDPALYHLMLDTTALELDTCVDLIVTAAHDRVRDSEAVGSRPEEPSTVKLGPVQYLVYAAGDVANNLTFSMVSAFLLIYYTDVAGISAATAGTLFLVVRIWGGVTDLFAGRRVDGTSTRWGKFRPYLLFGPVPLLAARSSPSSPSRAESATAAKSPGRTSPTRCSRSPTASSTSPTARWPPR